MASTSFRRRFSGCGWTWWVRYAVLASAAIVSLLLALAVHRYLATPLGRLAPAIKDNEIRVEYMGASAPCGARGT